MALTAANYAVIQSIHGNGTIVHAQCSALMAVLNEALTLGNPDNVGLSLWSGNFAAFKQAFAGQYNEAMDDLEAAIQAVKDAVSAA